MKRIYFILLIVLFSVLPSIAATNKKHRDTAPASVKAVDLGLPSGTLWANMNLGASKPTDDGDHYAWGEVKPQTDENYRYTNKTYKWYDTNKNPTKYCSSLVST